VIAFEVTDMTSTRCVSAVTRAIKALKADILKVAPLQSYNIRAS
jgi:copper chaperone CopZ